MSPYLSHFSISEVKSWYKVVKRQGSPNGNANIDILSLDAKGSSSTMNNFKPTRLVMIFISRSMRELKKSQGVYQECEGDEG